MAEQFEFKKTVFGGLNEQEVKKYIDQLNDESQSREEALNDALKQKTENFEHDRRSFRSTLTQLQLTIERYGEENKTLQGKQEELLSRIEKLEKTNTELRKSVDEKEAIITGINAKLSKTARNNIILESRITTFEESKRKYELLNTRLGSILTQAHTQADKVVEDAMSEFESIASTSVKSIEYFSDNFEKLKSEIEGMYEAISGIKSYETSIRSSIGKFDSYMTNMRSSMVDALDLFKEEEQHVEINNNSLESQKASIKINMSVLEEIMRDEEKKMQHPASAE